MPPGSPKSMIIQRRALLEVSTPAFPGTAKTHTGTWTCTRTERTIRGDAHATAKRYAFTRMDAHRSSYPLNRGPHRECLPLARAA